MKRIIQVSTVHRWSDNRIYEKIVLGLARSGYMVHYVVTRPTDGNIPDEKGVTFHWLRERKGTWGRVLKQLDALRTVLRIGEFRVHFHDPELIPMGLALRMLGRDVVYDIHEDNNLGIRQKRHLARWIRNPLAFAVANIEKIAAKFLDTVIAERVYAERFPNAVLVLNYPKLDPLPHTAPFDPNGPQRFLYTGRVSSDRGAFTHLELLKALPGAELHLSGTCSFRLKQTMIEEAGSDAGRLIFDTTEHGVPYSHIKKRYLEGQWTAALALFPLTPHYFEKELTKFFEYMAHGIPIICSDFPVWEDLVAGNKCGYCISPETLGYSELEMAVSDCQDPEKRKSVAEAGRELVTTRYTWKSQLDSLIRLYEEQRR